MLNGNKAAASSIMLMGIAAIPARKGGALRSSSKTDGRPISFAM